MEVQSTNPQESKKLDFRIIIYLVVWLLLFAAVSTAIWFDIIRQPIDKSRIDQIMACNKYIETLCGNLPSDAQSNCQEKIKTAIQNVAVQSWYDQRKRLWLILLSLVIGVPLLWAAVRAFTTTSEERKPLWIVICYVIILLLVLVVVSIAVWNRPDFFIAYAPVPILEWGFAGGMLAVIHRLASGRYSSVNGLYPWIVARPIIGLFMGGVIYFIALAGGILTNAPLTSEGQLPKNLWLNAVAFIAAFNDRFTEAIIGRVTSMFVPQSEEKNYDKEGSREEDKTAR
jgi:hypothetical protein